MTRKVIIFVACSVLICVNLGCARQKIGSVSRVEGAPRLLILEKIGANGSAVAVLDFFEEFPYALPDGKVQMVMAARVRFERNEISKKVRVIAEDAICDAFLTNNQFNNSEVVDTKSSVEWCLEETDMIRVNGAILKVNKCVGVVVGKGH